MKRQLSLKLFIVLAFLSFGIVLVIGYSLLSAHYFVRGMDSITASNMEEAAVSYLKSIPATQRKTLNSFSGYQIAEQWQQMPGEIRQAFAQPPSESGILLKHDDSGGFAPPDIIYFAMQYKQGNNTLFVSRRLSRSTASKLVGRNAARSMQLLLLISLSIAVTLAVIIALLLKRVSRPVKALGQWARDLDSDRLNLPPPDFSYPELNEFAVLIRSSLSSVQESLEREHRFLRYTSHELRTPIAVIRNNIELIRKLKGSPSQKWSPPQLQGINRIDRASLTMQHLTETLLWLSRDLAVSLQEQQVDLDEMIRQLVEEMRYLLNKKDVKLELKTEPCTLLLPESPARIVLGNLIRNAFQHTWQGRVTISQHSNLVEITNEQSGEAEDSQDLGFGLGLQLTAELTAKLGWAYADENGPDGYRVKVLFSPVVQEPEENGGEKRGDNLLF